MLADQKEFVRLIAQGASPAAACSLLKVPVDCAYLTFECDQRFRKRLETVFLSLTDNVRAALYREAVKGKVAAQTFWLKSEPQQTRRAPGAMPASREALLSDLARIMAAFQGENAGRGEP